GPVPRRERAAGRAGKAGRARHRPGERRRSRGARARGRTIEGGRPRDAPRRRLGGEIPAAVPRPGGCAAHDHRATPRPDRDAHDAGARAQYYGVHPDASDRRDPEADEAVAWPHDRFHGRVRRAIFSGDMVRPSPSGTIRVRLFARYAELLRRAQSADALPLPATVADPGWTAAHE